MSAAPAMQVWYTEAEAAAYCRCSLRAFRAMRLEAHNAGGRKVYNRATLDAGLTSRPWQPSTSAAPRITSTGARTAFSTAAASDRLTEKPLRPYAPRKKRS